MIVTHRGVISLAGAVILLAACGTAPHKFYASQSRCASQEPDPEAAKVCLAKPEVRAYMEQVQREVLEGWRLPRGIAPGQKVAVAFQLREDGSLECLSTSPAGEERLRESIISAFQRAVPFAEVPRESVCLTELPVTATFSNPLGQP